MAKKPKKHMTREEIEKLDEIYQYVKSNVMKYDEEQALPSKYVMRIKGMLHGKFYESYSTKDFADYSYDLVLNTFKYSMPDIQRALDTVSFKDEKHKFNYVMKIVEGNLNEVYKRMKRKERVKEEIERDVKNSIPVKEIEYKPKDKEYKFEDLWSDDDDDDEYGLEDLLY